MDFEQEIRGILDDFKANRLFNLVALLETQLQK